MSQYIKIKGAKEQNLKNIDIDIPKNMLVTVTGLSGSGKSSLVFDTIYAEAQRKYVESLSAYARQFLELQEKPDVDSITGLSPAIAIDQKNTSKNPRSTVGTITEIYDYLRLLFARIGILYSPTTGLPIKSQTVTEITDLVLSLPKGTRIYILGPIARGEKGEFKKEILQYKKQGFERLIVDEEEVLIDNFPKIDKNKKHNIDIIIDRVVISEALGNRIPESIERAIKIGNGILHVKVVSLPEEHTPEDDKNFENGQILTFSSKYSCPVSGFQIEEIEPRIFSFNSPFGACRKCDGLGKEKAFSIDLIVPDDALSIKNGAIKPWGKDNVAALNILRALSKHYGFNFDEPFSSLTEKQKEVLFFGSGEEKIKFVANGEYIESPFGGILHSMDEKYAAASNDVARQELQKYMVDNKCSACEGHRLRKESLCIKIGNYNIADICDLSIRDLFIWISELPSKLTAKETTISDKVIKEMSERIKFLVNVGLEYLQLSRTAGTLSGGESQRIRLASQIRSGLTGVLYVLDEPSIGLHQRDNTKLITTLKELRDLGNSVLVVEHDDETMLSSNYLIDIGPGAGIYGGRITAHGTVEEVIKNPNSLTGKYLSGELSIPIPKKRRKIDFNKCIEILGARSNNLKNVNVKIPLSAFVVVTGVSGGGKSSLILHTLYKAAMRYLEPTSRVVPGEHDSITGFNHIDKVIDIDQSPIGRTPRSNPATYTGLFNHIRNWFAELPESKARGYKISRFSFNVKGGRCEACQGDGLIKIEMHFLPDVYVKCDVCNGKRYSRETLEVKYKDKSIADVLDMSAEEAMNFFDKVPSIYEKLKVICKVGLGYIKIGQSAVTLSGGEAQRVKLAKELSKRSSGKTLYILDEPTTGLHFEDIKKLLEILHHLADIGNSIVIIEHNMDVIKTADYIVDIGPEGGNFGGKVVACGCPDDIAKNPESITGQYVKKYL